MTSQILEDTWKITTTERIETTGIMSAKRKKKETASEDSLGSLHYEIAEYMLERVGEAKENKEIISPATLSAIIRFLKDNSITASIEAGSPIEQLTREFSAQELELVQADCG